jgi:hypothetical protein
MTDQLTEEFAYHNALCDIASFIRIYGIDVVMIDVYDRLEIEQQQGDRVYD